MHVLQVKTVKYTSETFWLVHALCMLLAFRACYMCSVSSVYFDLTEGHVTTSADQFDTAVCLRATQNKRIISQKVKCGR